MKVEAGRSRHQPPNDLLRRREWQCTTLRNTRLLRHRCRSRLLRCVLLRGLWRISLLRHRCLLGNIRLLHLTVNLPSLNTIEELARTLRVLTNVNVDMNSQLLADLNVQLLNPTVAHFKYHALRVLSVLMLNNVRGTRPLIASLLAHSLLKRKCLGDNTRYDNVHNLLTLKLLLFCALRIHKV